jgi:p21-activated kinase 1
LRLCGGAATASVPIGRQTQTVELQRWRAKLKEVAAISPRTLGNKSRCRERFGASREIALLLHCTALHTCPLSAVRCPLSAVRLRAALTRVTTTAMDEPKGRRLIKRHGPPISYLNHKSHTGSLQRSPSDASYFNQSLSRMHAPAPAPSSATTPGAHPSATLLAPVHEQIARSHLLPAPASGAPFTTAVLEEALHASAAGPRRPSPPQHSHTYAADQPAARYTSPRLRQSASYTALARKMDTPPSGTKSPRNRYSDEGDAAKKRYSGGAKKKGTFSNFMSSLVSSPRRPTISTPTNPMHVTHVSIDNETGEFTVRPR